jgi:DNA sulfur modification protein DndC
MSTSAFHELGLKKTILAKIEQIQEIYLADQIPWVIGYSGGKDSTAALQLVWMALKELPADKRNHKDVHVISTDTLVENPIVATWVRKSLKQIELQAERDGLPLTPHELQPTTQDSYWVNLLGKGYPAPRNKFRWCTLRLKINPSNRFIKNMVSSHGEAIVVLGTRSAESAARANVISEHKKLRERTGFYLSPNSALENCFIFSPVEEWSNDDVWQFLLSYDNPWGYSNENLMSLYRGATSGGECPLVVDTTTESCGKSRFGCWVCTLVEEDKSMAAMISNDMEKEWLSPLLDFRNELEFRSKTLPDGTRDDSNRQRDRSRRDFRRMHGQVNLYNDNIVPGPYTQAARKELLELLLQVEQAVQEMAPEGYEDISIITDRELQEIRRIWVVEKNEVEDLLPEIYKAETGKELNDDSIYPNGVGKETYQLLKELCGDDFLQYEMLRDLINTEHRYRTMSRRAGLFEELEKSIKHSFYEDVDDAKQMAVRKTTAHGEINTAREERTSFELVNKHQR